MGDQVYVQCQTCGHLSKVNKKYASVDDDDLYTKPLFCPKCRNDTKHLLIGEHQDDVYLYGNANLDIRYYEYNTK